MNEYIYMHVTVAWSKLGLLQHGSYGVVHFSSFCSRFGYGYPFRCPFERFADEDLTDCGFDDGSGGPLVGYYPHFSLELGRDDDDALGCFCTDGDGFWGDPY